MPKKLQASTLENIFVSEGHRALYNEITYLKKRIHLVEGERKANYESNEAIIKKNGKALQAIKEKNKEFKQTRKCMVDTRSNYFKKIAQVLGGEKKAYEFKDKDVREVLEILEYKIGTLRNKLNVLDYKKLHYAQEMSGAFQTEATLRRRVVKKAGPTDTRIDELKSTETSTAAMQMKTTEAENVRARYKHMYGVLKDENYTQSVRLTDLESNLEKQEREIARIHAVLKDANKARRSARTHLTQAEEETIEEFSGREQELYEARMKLKIIRDKMESIGAKLSYPKFHIIHRDSSITDGLFPQMNANLDQGDGLKSLSTVEAVYNELQELTGESDPKLLVIRFGKQRHHAKELLRDEQGMKSAVRKAKLRKRFLVDKLSQLQFSGGLTREELNEKADEISEEITSTTSERDRLDNIINEHVLMMEQMLPKLIEMCQHNELRPPSSTNGSPTGEKILILLKYILLKTEQVVNEQNALAATLLSPLPIRRSIIGSTGEVSTSRGGEEEMIGMPVPPTSDQFGSTGDISFTEQVDASMRSRRLSLTDITMQEMNPIDKLLTVDGIESAMSAVSPMSDSTGFQLQLHLPNEDVREDSEKPKERSHFASTTRGQESSEEEEAVSRNFVKRQSQILFEAKTRKGRFNPNTAPAVRHRRY